MKIALLTRNPKLFSHQRLMETAIARGHEIVPVDYLHCYMNITSHRPERDLPRQPARRLRRGHSENRGLQNVLRHGRRAAVRNDGRFFGQ